MSEILSRTEVKANKPHTCDVCNGRIEKGARYIRESFRDGGNIHQTKTHIHCDFLAERYCMASGQDVYCGDDVADWARDEVCNGCETCTEERTLLCPKVIRALMPPTLLTHEEVRRYTEAK